MEKFAEKPFIFLAPTGAKEGIKCVLLSVTKKINLENLRVQWKLRGVTPEKLHRIKAQEKKGSMQKGSKQNGSKIWERLLNEEQIAQFEVVEDGLYIAELMDVVGGGGQSPKKVRSRGTKFPGRF